MNRDNPEASPGRGEGLGIATVGILVGGALVLRFAFSGAKSVLVGDEIHYAESLYHFMRGGFREGFSEYWSFFYPLVAWPFGMLAGDAEAGLRLLSVLSGAALVVPVLLIANWLWGRRPALYAGLLVAIHPSLIDFSSCACTESLYTFLLFLFLYFVLRAMRGGGPRELLLAGLFAGFAYMTRQEVQGLVAVAVLMLLASGGGEPARRRLRLSRAAMLAAAFVIAVSPLYFLVHRETGRWSAGSKAAVNLASPEIWEDGLARERFVYSLDETGTSRRIDEIGRENPLRLLWRSRGELAARYPSQMMAGLARLPALLASPFLLLLVPLGLLGRGWRPGARKAELFMLLCGIFPFLLFPLFRIETRYLVPFLPVYLLWGGYGCDVLVSWIGENVSRRGAAGVIALVLIFTSLVPFTIRRYSALAGALPVEYRSIGRWIREYTGDRPRIMTRPGCSVGYYAGNPVSSFIPWADVDGLLWYARAHRFDYLLVEEAYLRSYRPMLVSLLDDPPEYELAEIRRFPLHDGGIAVLFRFER